jgi:hypothetical protein
MCVYVHVCTRVWVCVVCTGTCVFRCVLVCASCAHVCGHVGTCVHMCVHAFVCVCMLFLCVLMCVSVCMHMNMFMHVHVSVVACIYTCVQLCANGCVHAYLPVYVQMHVCACVCAPAFLSRLWKKQLRSWSPAIAHQLCLCLWLPLSSPLLELTWNGPGRVIMASLLEPLPFIPKCFVICIHHRIPVGDQPVTPERRY